MRVVDLEGRPIPGCAVDGPGEPKDGEFAVTGPDGRVTLTDLYEEEVRISASAPGGVVGMAPLPDGTVMPAPVAVVPRGQEITMALRKGEPRTGRVLDPEGRPAAMACVTLQTDDYVLGRHWTGPDGRYTVWVSPGRKLIRATAWQATREPGAVPLVADPGEEEVPQEGEILLRLAPRARR